ncbi:hypothetical protein M441DRAFT_31853 [Trichoderma asperellum CBS 433.97]|uniref:Zn(2)-C6 fungal-type domain-containing protein n=2 Tax=Trichoderma asperellum TaxID=101201 RepID=A0A2T3YT17_TRIA4|nr:hypothetical protein M441DRAFT_31853 [Trichoderma asperellum CBS 433.97]PTB35646.1 hypothetical protein M441DRAFT_31853 [Trichoderma asperellum CBS 433.97]
MVGVPGRSKGCVTCRRRKKGCDKNVPSCHQCIRSGLQCGGYGRDLVWVNTTPDGDDTGKAVPLPTRGKSSSTSSTQQRPWSVIYTTRGANHVNTNITLHDSLTRSAREELYFSTLISTALPYGHLLSARASDVLTNGWVSAVKAYYDKEPAIRYASLAMSVGFMGVEERKKQITQSSQMTLQGFEAYNKAILEMVRGLSDSKRSKNDGIIVAARILQFYELFFGKAPDWRAHIEGQLALFLARGPESFVSGQAHQLYVDGRILIVMLSIGRRAKSPLHTPEWRSTPWRDIPKSTKDKLIDILEDVPFMLIAYDELRACQDPERFDELRQIVMLNCQHIATSLDVWEEEAGPILRQFDYTFSGSPLPTPQDDTEFGLVYISGCYWGARLMLYSTLGMTLAHSAGAASPGADSIPSMNGSSPASTAGTASTPATSPGQSSEKSPGPYYSPPQIKMENPGIYARKIAHMVHLLYEPAAGAMQGASGLFPLALALRFFATTEPPGQRSLESEMLYRLYRKPFVGTFVGRFLNDLQGSQQDDEAKRDSEAKAQRNIFWYAVLGSENIVRVGEKTK